MNRESHIGTQHGKGTSAGHFPAPPAENDEIRRQAVTLLTQGADLIIPYLSALAVVRQKLPEISSTIEKSTTDLSAKFQTLAMDAKTQGDRVQKIADIASYLEYQGEHISLSDALKLIDETVSNATNKILFVSKIAMSMVYSLNGAMAQLHDVEAFIAHVQKITKQTNLLSLNATIEATRAGEAGRGFRVVADEVKNLSKEISKLSQEMSQKIGNVSQSVKEGYNTLEQVATVDMSDAIIVQQKIDALMGSILKQNAESRRILGQTAEASQKASQTISSMIIEMQFQDKVSQNLGNIVAVMEQMGASMETWRNQALPLVPENDDATALHLAEKMSGVFTLSELRQQFTKFLMENGCHLATPSGVGEVQGSGNGNNDDDDVELF